MNTKWFIPIICLAFVSCKKQGLKSLFGREDDQVMQKSMSHPLSYCNDGNPIGGGAGYSSIIKPFQADVVITTNMTAPSFKTLIEASANKTIYIDPNVVIDLNGLTQSIKLPANIVIASNRGAGGSLGALIKTDDICYDNGSSCGFSREVFLSNGNNIRITGLQFRGPWSSIGVDDKKFRTGILMKGHDGLEVDNCDLSSWPYSPIAIGQNQDPTGYSNNNNNIHHNYIHANKQAGYGYGVAVNNGFAVIKANTFENNRHDIACSGSRNTNNTGYEASCNVVLQGGTDINFDVHGQDKDTKPNASTFFYIHHNYFMDIGTTASRPGNAWMQNIGIRGVPDNQCRIENNIFKQEGPTSAIKQGSTGGAANSQGNLLVWNNIYGYGLNGGPGSYLGWYVKPTWSKKGVSNFMNLESTNDILMSSIGNITIVDYALGDYDGDGKTDIYKIQDGKLFVMPYEITNGLTQGWTQIATMSYVMTQLRFGHFNSDNKTDVVVKDVGNIYVSYGCNSSWTLMGSTTYPLSSIRSGDLTGDGIHDFFTADGGKFWMINNAIPGSSWTQIASSTSNIANLKLGWFDLNSADPKIDVFFADGTYFYAAYDGTQTWVNIATSGYLASDLDVWDFDSDGVSDVINTSRQVSLKARMPWANTTLNNFPLSTFTYGNLN